MTKKDSPGVIAFPPLMTAIAIGIGAASHAIYAVDLAPHGLVRLVGAIVILGALVLLVAASATMVRSGTNVNPSLPALAIVSRGPFRFTRNPMYVSMCLLSLGGGLLLSDLVAVLMTLPLFALLHYGVILREERYLTEKFGATYTDYKATVRLWI